MKDISYGKESDTNLKLIISLARSSNKIRRSESDIIRNSGLTFPQFGVLEVLYHKGDLRVCQIIEKTLSTGGNMTVVIQNLIKEGLISRYKDPKDNRAFIVHLTDKGRQRIEDVFPKHLANLNQALAHLTIEEKEHLHYLLKRLNHIL